MKTEFFLQALITNIFFLNIYLVTSNGKSVYWQGEKISQYVFIVSRSRVERRR